MPICQTPTLALAFASWLFPCMIALLSHLSFCASLCITCLTFFLSHNVNVKELVFLLLNFNVQFRILGRGSLNRALRCISSWAPAPSLWPCMGELWSRNKKEKKQTKETKPKFCFCGDFYEVLVWAFLYMLTRWGRCHLTAIRCSKEKGNSWGTWTYYCIYLQMNVLVLTLCLPW